MTHASTPRAADAATARCSLNGIPLDPIPLEAALAWTLRRAAGDGPFALVATINVDILRVARADAAFATLLRERSALNLVDGWPVMRLLRGACATDVARTAGSDLTASLLTDARVRPLGLFLFGDTPETLDRVRARGAAEGWGPVVRDAVSPSRAEVDDEAASRALVERINASGARILLTAFGAPRQEAWMARWSDALAPRLGIGIGGSLKFIASPRRRAPEWMQRAGFEWLHRLALEPRRLGPRYLHDAIELARLALDRERPGHGRGGG